MAKSSLGRGLGALLGKNPQTASPSPTLAKAKEAHSSARSDSHPTGATSELPLTQVKPCSFQPRKEFTKEALQDLANSIREQGVLQPLVVRPLDGGYEIIAGERRWRAAQQAGLKTVPAVIRDADDKTTLELALVENLQREDLNPIEAALGYSQLIERFRLTQEQVANQVGKSRAAVANALRLLNLAPDVRAHVRDGRLSVGHAKVILSLSSAEQQNLAADRILRDGLSVRETEKLISSLQSKSASSTTASTGTAGKSDAKTHDTHVARLESLLQEKFGTKVSLRYQQGKGGSLQIKFFNDEDLERILQVSGVTLD